MEDPFQYMYRVRGAETRERARQTPRVIFLHQEHEHAVLYLFTECVENIRESDGPS